jgi:membrane-associated phospholipid phosphatase
MVSIICSVIMFFSINCNLSAQTFDIDLLRDINLHRNKSLDPAFRGISCTPYPLSIGTPVILYSIGLIKRDSLCKQKAIYIGVTLVSAMFITNVLKYTIDRTRPYEIYPDIDNAAEESSPSFPSGHTTSAFALATSLSLQYPKWYIIVPSFLWAGTVAYSRLDLGVHYPSDVLAGAIIGAGSAYLCYVINKRIRGK